jgi:drug/metabolite transporter (DMT)-like permease
MSDTRIYKPPAWILYLCMGLMVITGSCNTIINKLLNLTESLGYKFEKHFFFQTYMMFIGETFCLIAYQIYKLASKDKIKEDEKASGQPPINVFILAIPAACDFFGSTIMSFSLTMMAASIYQMTRGSIMIFTAIFSRVFLKTRIYRHQIFSLAVIFSGLALVGLAPLIEPDEHPDPDNDTKTLGVIALIIAQLFSAAQFVIEEKIVNKYYVHPLQMVGWEGIWGSLYYTILLGVAYFINCDVDNKFCSQYSPTQAKLENFIFAFQQLGANYVLLLLAIGYVCSIATYNFLGITITKYISSPARAVMDNGRTVIIWLFFLLAPFIPASWHEKFRYTELTGFVFLVAGTIIYNEFVVIPLCGLDYNTKKEIEKRKAYGLMPDKSDAEKPDTTLKTTKGDDSTI